MHNLRLTPAAHRGLLELGYATNYGHRQHSRMLAKLVHSWADVEQVWIDERPSHIRASDATADAYDLAHQWWGGDLTRLFCLGPLPMLYLIRVATRHRIEPFSRQRVMTVGRDLTRPRSKLRVSDFAQASAVLEAIGTRWLAPLTPLPPNPARLQVHNKHPLYG